MKVLVQRRWVFIFWWQRKYRLQQVDYATPRRTAVYLDSYWCVGIGPSSAKMNLMPCIAIRIKRISALQESLQEFWMLQSSLTEKTKTFQFYFFASISCSLKGRTTILSNWNGLVSLFLNSVYYSSSSWQNYGSMWKIYIRNKHV